MKQKISCTLFYKHSVLVFSFFVGWGAVSEYAYDFSKGSSIKCVRKISRKTNISNPLIRTRTCAYQGARNVSISENFAYLLHGWPLISAVYYAWNMLEVVEST